MRPRLALLGAVCALLGADAWSPGADEPEFTSLFDTRTLKGWEPQHTDRFVVKDGIIVNDGGTGWLRSARTYRDFELCAEYRVVRPGSDSGIFFRASREGQSKEPFWPARCYQLQIIDSDGNCMLFGHGLAPPRFERRSAELKKATRGARQWQKICLKVVGDHVEVALNDVVVTTSRGIQPGEGHIGLQAENGHFEWRGLRIREFPRPPR